MMNFLIYGLNFYPELVGIGKYTGELAQTLVEKGHNVSVVTAPPYYPYWRVPEGYQSWKYSVEREAVLQVIRCPLWVPKKATGLRRMAHLLSFALSSIPALLSNARKRPDLIFAIAPALAAAPAAALTGRIFNIPTWLHIQDFEVEVAFNLGIINQDRLFAGYKILRLIECEIYRHFDRVSSIANSMLRRLKERGVSSQQIVFFPNWVDINQILPEIGGNGYRSELGINDKCTVVLYSGSMGNKQGLEVILETARRLKAERQLQFVLCGEGQAKHDLQNGARDLENIHFLSLQPTEKLSQLLTTADIHILPQKRGAIDLVMPSKLLGMLASGRPVVAGCTSGSELFDIISLVGRVVPPEDSEALAETLVSLLYDLEKRKELGAQGRAYCVRHFAKDEIIDRFIREAEKLCK